MLLRFEGFAVQLLGTILSQPHDCPLCPYLQEYMWFFRTLLLKKPLQPSQLEAP